MTDLAISIENLGKMYRLYQNPGDKVIDAFGLNNILFWRKKTSKEFWALRGLNLKVRRGERIGIIGRNGAGKSTLLKIIAGTISSTEGKVKVYGKVQALMELGTGFHPEFTGRQNIRSSLAYQGFSEKLIRYKEAEIINFAELEDFIEQPVRTYSAGMYARLAFSTATAIEPEILIIDEVLGAGDAYFAGKCVERMKGIAESGGTTVLFVSHDLVSLQRLCPKAIWIKDGKILMTGRSHEIAKEYIKYTDQETEIRLRAREMQLGSKQVKALIKDEVDIYQKILFRFCTAQKHPLYNHPIYSISLYYGSEKITSIDLGSPMDNGQSNNRSYLIDDPANTDWSTVQKKQDAFFRTYTNRKSKDGHAPFVITVPSYLLDKKLDDSNSFSLEILHGSPKNETVYIEYFCQDSYKRIGKFQKHEKSRGVTKLSLKDFMKDFFVHSEGSQTAVGFHSVKLSSQPNDNSPVRERDDNSELGDARKCFIKQVYFLSDAGKNVKILALGNHLKVVIKYEALTTIIDPVFAITFHRIDGLQMDHKNSKLLNIDVGEVMGEGQAIFTFDPLRLGVGEYVVSVAILKYLSLDTWHDVPPSYDRHDRRYSLLVRSEEKNLGAVLQEAAFYHAPSAS